MSKGLGQKIVIKFTEELVGDVVGKPEPIAYKYYRWYITSTWSGSRLYLYELEIYNAGQKITTSSIISKEGSSQYSSSYSVNKLFDGSTSGEWDANGSLPHWCKIELSEPMVIDSFKWYTGTSGNKPKQFIFQGSNDGTNWINIYKTESPNTNNWIEFNVSAKGNEGAFTITGKEYKYVNGPLVDKDYQVEKVERYEAPKLWNFSTEIKLDATSGVTNEVTPLTSNTAPTPYRASASSEFDNSFQAYLAFNGNIEDRWVSTDAGCVPSWIWYDFSVEDKIINKVSITGFGATTSPKKFTVRGYNNADDGWVILLDKGGQINWSTKETREYTFDNNTPYRYYMIHITENNGGPQTQIAQIQYFSAEYEPIKTHLTQSITMSGQTRVRWLENKPAETSITIEYTTGQSQGAWVEVANGEVINADTNLWFRVTLETTDTSVTPTLQDLWIEEANAPDDKIRLVMHPQGRFNNVEGGLTVDYDASKGNLLGRGGAVESFSYDFTPIDLETKPNPHAAEIITITPYADIAFTRVHYNQRYGSEKIIATANATVVFTYVGTINP